MDPEDSYPTDTDSVVSSVNNNAPAAPSASLLRPNPTPPSGCPPLLLPLPPQRPRGAAPPGGAPHTAQWATGWTTAAQAGPVRSESIRAANGHVMMTYT
jgi:hypothetical protein